MTTFSRNNKIKYTAVALCKIQNNY